MKKAKPSHGYKRKPSIKKNKPGAGRPHKKIDPKQVEQLAMIQCTYKEMSAVLDCNEKTLMRNFGSIIEKGREEGKMSLKRMQYKAVQGGNVTMMIWLGKQYLGQKDKKEQEITYPQLERILENVTDAIAAEVKDPAAV